MTSSVISPVSSPFDAGSPEDREWHAINSRHYAGALTRGIDMYAAREATAPDVSDEDVAAHAAQLDRLNQAGVLFGPDCSQYQGKPNWATVRAAGCLIGGYKVSEGRTFVDPSHDWNRAQTAANGLQPLAYHYLYFSAEYVANPALWGAQAAFFCSLVDPNALHCLDVEDAATSGNHLGVKEWVAEYRKHFPDHPLGFYSNRAMWANRSRMPYDPTGLFDYVWHAGIGNGYYTSAQGSIAGQWGATSSLSNSFAANGYPSCQLWQITDHGQVPGVGGSFCDGNAFQGTLAELQALASGAVHPPKPPAPLVVDGKLGPATVTRWQAYLNAHVGNPKLVVDGALGPDTWKAAQRWVGVGVDGIPGPTTISALQRKVGSPIDGALGVNTVKALQTYLNGHA